MKNFFLAAALASLCISATGLQAQEPQEQQGAFTVPRSNRVIKGELIFPDKSKAQFVVRDGTWVTVEDQKGFYGFAGIIKNKTLMPNFQVYRLVRTAQGTVAVEIKEQFDTPLEKRFPLSIAGKTTLLVHGTSEWQFSSLPIADPSQYSDLELKEFFDPGTGDDVCCVTCGERTVCASAVAGSCGSCNGGRREFESN